jgi:hypothetical protein
MKRLNALLLLMLGAVLLAGCTLVPTANSPTIVTKKIPFGLLGQTIPGTNNGRVRFVTQAVYIVDATGHLAATSRIVPSPPTLLSVLRELILGPTSIETFAGYTSDLPKNFVIVDAVVKDKIGYIDIATPLSSLSRSRQVLAVGQLVLTAQAPGVGATTGVQISVAGVLQETLLPDGRTSELVTANDFSSLLNH